ncbi:Ion transport 2 domain protein [Thiocapsa marina 5811]|jgi:hypothetical protein|uniref:Ion transport 2 domain protein n=2 Tax=Thiocapsa marina TaxID=244573 RepID=F9UB62_9GAMM|nr:Ion transport 2 domain protein [Thiocapsa marina 5811]
MSNRAEWTGRRRVRRVFGFAVLVACVLFFFHANLLFESAALILRNVDPLIEHLGAGRAGKVIIFGCFAMLFAAHLAEAAVWGLYVWRQGLTRTYADGIYFTAVTVTALGYGDVVLLPPWRMLGPLIAIAGLLKFGCSTAFLFVVIQAIWTRHLV